MNAFNDMFISRVEDASDALITSMFNEYWKNFAYFGVPHADNFTQWPLYYKPVKVG